MNSKGYRLLLGITLLLASASVFLSALLFTRLEINTKRTNAALCELRTDISRRVASTQKFLAQNPRGIPGVPVATLRQSLDGQKSTVKALSGLDCPPPPRFP